MTDNEWDEIQVGDELEYTKDIGSFAGVKLKITKIISPTNIIYTMLDPANSGYAIGDIAGAQKDVSAPSLIYLKKNKKIVQKITSRINLIEL